MCRGRSAHAGRAARCRAEGAGRPLRTGVRLRTIRLRGRTLRKGRPGQERGGLCHRRTKYVEVATEAVEAAEPADPQNEPQPCSAPPAFVFGGGVLPTPLLGAILDRATLREVRHPGQAAPEPRYTPSRKIAEFVQCRDLTCRFPGCDKSAQVCDIDHTVLYPVGPTHASNLKCLCRFHHSTKTVCSPDQAVQTQESRKRTWPPRQDLGWWPGAIAMARLLDHKRLATTHPTSQRQLTAALDSPCFTLALHQGRLSGGGLTRQGCSAGVPGSDMGRA